MPTDRKADWNNEPGWCQRRPSSRDFRYVVTRGRSGQTKGCTWSSSITNIHLVYKRLSVRPKFGVLDLAQRSGDKTSEVKASGNAERSSRPGTWLSLPSHRCRTQPPVDSICMTSSILYILLPVVISNTLADTRSIASFLVIKYWKETVPIATLIAA